MELKETVEMMNSADYKERFKAEYFQLKIRYEKLKDMLEKWDNGELDFKPTVSRFIYNVQIYLMKNYLDVLEFRAMQENVNFESED